MFVSNDCQNASLINRPSVPTKRATVSLIRIKSCSAFLHVLLLCICRYLETFAFLSYTFLILGTYHPEADPSGRAVWGVDLRPLACWDCGFESRWGHGSLSLATIVYCQVGLITRPEEIYRVGVSECDREALIMRRSRPIRAVVPWEKKILRALYLCEQNMRIHGYFSKLKGGPRAKKFGRNTDLW